MNLISKKNAWVFMILITFCWGGSYVCTKFVTDHIDPTLAFFLGGVIGAIIFFAINLRRLAGFDRRQLGLIMKINLFSMLSNITSIIGIQYTTSTNAAFIPAALCGHGAVADVDPKASAAFAGDSPWLWCRIGRSGLSNS